MEDASQSVMDVVEGRTTSDGPVGQGTRTQIRSAGETAEDRDGVVLSVTLEVRPSRAVA